jgi:PAS domain-containing protein
MTNLERRLKALEDYQIMDSESEKEFNDIVELASAFYGTPISAITLLDNYRQWFKARVGLDDESTKIEDAYCRYTIQNPDEVLIVEDSTKDERFVNNPFTTGDDHIRFYAGAPLVTADGVALGALCVIDKEPRKFSDEEARVLKVLANKVMRLFDLRKENMQQRRQIANAKTELNSMLARYVEAQKTAHIGNWDFNVHSKELYWSPEMFTLLLKKEGNTDKGNLADWENLIHPDDIQVVREAMDRALKTRRATTAEFRIVSGGTETWLLGRADIMYNGQGKIERIYGTLQDITERKQAERDRNLYTQMLETILFDVSHKIRKPLTTITGLLPVLNNKDVPQEKYSQVYDYFLASANELEGYTRELNDLLHKSKIDISAAEKREAVATH